MLILILAELDLVYSLLTFPCNINIMSYMSKAEAYEVDDRTTAPTAPGYRHNQASKLVPLDHQLLSTKQI